jgi:hypothetical protein
MKRKGVARESPVIRHETAYSPKNIFAMNLPVSSPGNARQSPVIRHETAYSPGIFLE